MVVVLGLVELLAGFARGWKQSQRLSYRRRQRIASNENVMASCPEADTGLRGYYY